MKMVFYLRRSRLKRGKCPVVFYVTANGIKSKERSTGQYIRPQEWDAGEVSRAVRGKLDEIETRLREVFLRLKREGNSRPTGPDVLAAVEDEASPVPALIDVAADYVKAQQATGRKRRRKPNEPTRTGQAKATGKAHSSRLNILTHYVDGVLKGRRSVLITGVNNQFAERYERYLRTQHVLRAGRRKGEVGLISTSVEKHIQFLEQVLDYAVRKDLLKHNPLTVYRVDTSDVARDLTRLDDAELAHLRDFRFVSAYLQRAVDVFLLMCEVGLSHCDQRGAGADNHLTADDLPPYLAERLRGTDLEEWLQGQRQKTGVTFAVPLTPFARKLIDKYGGVEHLPKLENSPLNRALREAFQIAGIPKHATTKLARKTFLHRWRNAPGVAKKTVTKMAGHSTEAMLDWYADTTLEGVAFDLLNARSA